jgi:hypothetical protein
MRTSTKAMVVAAALLAGCHPTKRQVVMATGASMMVIGAGIAEGDRADADGRDSSAAMALATVGLLTVGAALVPSQQ